MNPCDGCFLTQYILLPVNWHSSNMRIATKFSKVSKDIIDNFIAIIPQRYNQLKLINISPDIKEFVYTKSHFSIIYNNLTKEDEVRGTVKSTPYYAMLLERTMRKLYREGNTPITGEYRKAPNFGHSTRIN